MRAPCGRGLHTLRKTVVTFLDDADVSLRKIADQLGHSKVR
jgi:integrase